MDFIKMIMELPGEKRSQDVVEHTEWNNLWRLIVTQSNHSENYLEQLYDYLFNKEGWVHKVQAELDGVQPYLEGVMTQPVGKAPDGSLWTYPSTESGTVPWGNVMGDITKQQDLIQKFNTKSDVGHKHNIDTLIFTEGDINGSWLADGSIDEVAYGLKSIPTSALKDLSITSEKLNNDAVTSAKIANGAVSDVKISDNAITRIKLAKDALYSPIEHFDGAHALTVSDIGKTLASSGVAENTVTLTTAISATMPIGTEIAVFWMAGTSVKLQFIGTMRIVMPGKDVLVNGSLQLSEKFTLVALKKIQIDVANGDIWTVQGDVEVVI